MPTLLAGFELGLRILLSYLTFLLPTAIGPKHFFLRNPTDFSIFHFRLSFRHPLWFQYQSVRPETRRLLLPQLQLRGPT